MKTLQLVKKKITLVLVASIYMTIGGLAQISQGGEPYNWNDKRIDTEIPYYNLPELDIELLTAQDVINDQHKELPFRFGVEHEVSLNVENSGRWTSLNNVEDGHRSITDILFGNWVYIVLRQLR